MKRCFGCANRSPVNLNLRLNNAHVCMIKCARACATCLLGYLVPLAAHSAPVSWCWKTHSQRCLAAAVAAAAIAKHLLITIFGDCRGVEGLSNKFRSPF